MAFTCAAALFPTKIITRLDPVVTASKLLEKNVTDSEKSVENSFEGIMSRHNYHLSHLGAFLKLG